MTEQKPVNTELAAKVPVLPDAQTVTAVTHYTDTLFSFRVTRPATMRFRSGEFVMIGLMGDPDPKTGKQRPLLRVNALRIRTSLQLSIGNLLEARKHARRAELLQAQQGSLERFGATTGAMELILYANLGDAKSVQGCLRSREVVELQLPLLRADRDDRW